MATLIKDTPIIFGEDAKRFREELRKAVSQPSSQEENAIMERNYNLMVSISNGSFY